MGAVYEAIMLLVEMEIDELLAPTCEEIDDCYMLVGSLADAVLWDEDWKGSEQHLDVDPKAGRAMKKLLGIDDYYFVAVAPDPSDEKMDGIWATPRALTRGGARPI